MLGLNPSQHGLVNTAVAAAVSTGSSSFPRALLSDSPRASSCNPVPGFHVYPQASRLSGECLLEVSMVAPSTPAPTTIDLNATPVAGGSSSGGARKRARQTPADQLSGARNLFDGMPAAGHDDYMQNMVFEGGAQATGFDPDETQSQDGRGYNEDQAAFMCDHLAVDLDLDGFPLDHEFPEDYGLEEEDECVIEAEPLFEDELANQADRTAPKRKSKRTKAYTAAEDKLLCECWRDIGQDPNTGVEQKHSTFWIRVHREFNERKKFPTSQIASARGWLYISKRWRVIQQECNKFCATFESIKARPMSGISVQDMGDQRRGEVQGAICRPQVAWWEQAMEEVGDGEKAQPRGKTNSKKEDNRDAPSIALIATVEDVITKKDSREEKRRQEREEQINAFLELQRRRLDMEAEKQARMLEMEAEKQAKMLEIEAANAKTKAKEMALASMMTGVEIMKVDLNTVSPRKRPWFEKMQANMLNFDNE
ncbi:DNA repair protein rhp54 [Hordeum vulgare]|nr:DNA repair protein rhp54 [Hordeum vulgare]